MRQWRQIPSCPDYEVSDDGLVRRIRDARPSKAGRILVGLIDALGRRRYKLVHPDGGNRLRMASRLVLEAFIGPDDRFACHRDGDYTNNRLPNLYYGTQKENMADRERHGHTPRGELNGEAKLTERQVIEIRERFATRRLNLTALGAQFGVTGTMVSAIVTGRSWAAAPGPLFRSPGLRNARPDQFVRVR